MAAVMAAGGQGSAAAPAPAPSAQAGGGGGATPAGPPPKSEMSGMLQQLNLESIRTRSHDLYSAISSILQSFQTTPHHKWPDVLGLFSMVNVELLNLVEDIKQILKMFVVHPKNVNAENAQILPVMLSSKLLPEMESEEAALKEQILTGMSNLPLQLQTEKLQKQIGMVIKACEVAEKTLTENRKLYGLGSRQVPAIIPPLDKAQAAKIAEQEKSLRAAVNTGEGLRLLQSERQQPISLPQHLVVALQSADGGSTYQNTVSTGASKGLPQPSSAGALAGASQQVTAAQILNRNVPSPMPIIGATTLDGAAASPMFTNSPRSANTNFTDLSPQQQQQSLLQRHKVQQMQKQQQLQQQQQQQLRQPATPPIGQGHFQQLQHQAQLQLQAQERQHLHLQQMQQQRLQQQQQQLQSNSLQPGQQLHQSLGQNHLAAGQIKPHLGQIGSNAAGSLFGNTQMNANMMASLGTNIQPQTAMLQPRLHLQGVGMGATGQTQRQLLTDPMYNMGLAGTQNTANLGLPLQQQLVGQSNFNSILNPNQTLNFGQQRQQPPPQ